MLSQNGPELVTNAWHTFIIHVNSHNIFMWKYSTTLQIRIVSGSRFGQRSGRLKINIRWTLVHFGSHTFVPKSWMCKKQTSVSHSSTEAEFICSMQFDVWMEFQLLIFWILFKKCFILPKPVQQHQRSSTGKPHQTSTPKTKPGFQPSTTILI